MYLLYKKGLLIRKKKLELHILAKQWFGTQHFKLNIAEERNRQPKSCKHFWLIQNIYVEFYLKKYRKTLAYTNMKSKIKWITKICLPKSVDEINNINLYYRLSISYR